MDRIRTTAINISCIGGVDDFSLDDGIWGLLSPVHQGLLASHSVPVHLQERGGGVECLVFRRETFPGGILILRNFVFNGIPPNLMDFLTVILAKSNKITKILRGIPLYGIPLDTLGEKKEQKQI